MSVRQESLKCKKLLGRLQRARYPLSGAILSPREPLHQNHLLQSPTTQASFGSLPIQGGSEGDIRHWFDQSVKWGHLVKKDPTARNGFRCEAPGEADQLGDGDEGEGQQVKEGLHQEEERDDHPVPGNAELFHGE